MLDSAVPTLEPPPTPQDVAPEKKVLFDSIAQDSLEPVESAQGASLKAAFAGLLWFGYAIAIVVALILVWSAANGLLQSLPH